MSTPAPTSIPAPPDRPDDAHKGTFGTVIVVGGCATMMGAPALCAAAAFRSGAGLVKIAAEVQVLRVAIGIEPGATGIILGDDVATNLAEIEGTVSAGQTVLAVGPGLGKAADRAELLDRLLRGDRPMVLDADGLNLLAETGGARPEGASEVVLTPHPGEYRRLAMAVGIEMDPTDLGTRPDAAAALARAHRAVVVLKGRRTVVAGGTRNYVNQTGNPALATAGSGDVLTGCIAALMAQGMAGFDAAALGVYLHGLAADLWARDHGQGGMTALDLAGRLPDAFEAHRRACGGR